MRNKPNIILAGFEAPKECKAQWMKKYTVHELQTPLAFQTCRLQKNLNDAILLAPPDTYLLISDTAPAERWIAITDNAPGRSFALRLGAFATLPLVGIENTAGKLIESLTTPQIKIPLQPYLNNLPLPTLLIDQYERILAGNQILQDLLSYPIEQLKGKHLSLFLKQNKQSLISDILTQHNLELTTATSDIYPLQITCAPYPQIPDTYIVQGTVGKAIIHKESISHPVRLPHHALKTLPPEEILGEVLKAIPATIPEAVNGLYLTKKENELILDIAASAQTTGAKYSAIMGFPIQRTQLPLTLIPRLQEMLAQPSVFTIAANELPNITNGMITPEQATKLQLAYNYTHLYFYPLDHPEGVLGFLLVMLKQPLSSASKIQVEQLGIIAAMALRGIQLRKQIRKQQAQISAMHAIGMRVSRSLDPQKVMERTVAEICQALGVEASAVSLIDRESMDLVIRAQTGLKQFAHTPVRIPHNKGVAWETLKSGNLSIIDSWEDEPRLAIPEFREEKVSTTVLVPMFVQDEPVGVLSAMSRTPRTFTQQEISLLESMADQVTIALNNARLYARTQRESQTRAFLFNLAASIVSIRDIEAATGKALNLTLEYLGWELGTCLLEDPESGALIPIVQTGAPQEVAKLINCLQRNDNHQNLLDDIIVINDKTTPYTIIQIPLQTRYKILGWLILGDEKAGSISKGLRQSLSAIGNYLGTAIENLQLFDETQEREKSTRALLQIIRVMMGNDLIDILRQTLAELKNAIPYEISGILTLTPTLTQMLTTQVQASDSWLQAFEEHLQDMVRTLGKDIPPLAENQRYITEAATGESNTPGQLISYLQAPIMRDEEPVGAVLLGRQRPFTTREQRLLFIVAYQLSNGLTILEKTRQVALRAESDIPPTHTLLNNVLHELRNPALFIQGYTELLLDNGMGELNMEQKNALLIIQQQSTLLSRLLHDLDSPEQLSAHPQQYQYTDIKALLSQAIEAAQISSNQHQIILTSSIIPNLPNVYVDQVRILQVINNLLDNAIKFTPSGGKIQVKADYKDTQCIWVEVKDTGPGITQQDLPFIFERRYQGQCGRQKSKGHGLGLAIAREIIESHGGIIGVTSDEGTGSTFYFTLPVNNHYN